MDFVLVRQTCRVNVCAVSVDSLLRKPYVLRCTVGFGQERCISGSTPRGRVKTWLGETRGRGMLHGKDPSRVTPTVPLTSVIKADGVRTLARMNVAVQSLGTAMYKSLKLAA